MGLAERDSTHPSRPGLPSRYRLARLAESKGQSLAAGPFFWKFDVCPNKGLGVAQGPGRVFNTAYDNTHWWTQMIYGENVNNAWIVLLKILCFSLFLRVGKSDIDVTTLSRGQSVDSLTYTVYIYIFHMNNRTLPCSSCYFGLFWANLPKLKTHHSKALGM